MDAKPYKRPAAPIQEDVFGWTSAAHQRGQFVVGLRTERAAATSVALASD
jgi:hypothetical protein